MHVTIHTAAALWLDHNVKDLAGEARLKAERVTQERLRRCTCAQYESPFKDCPDCGLDFQSQWGIQSPMVEDPVDRTSVSKS